MSLMFPTIYGIALRGLGDDAKLGSAGLICAIGGGCVMPPLQAVIMDGAGITLGALSLSATRISFLLPLLCFVVIAIYGWANFLASSRNAVTSA
jgi:FHS family L-fucose permease-like MFS transporter